MVTFISISINIVSVHNKHAVLCRKGYNPHTCVRYIHRITIAKNYEYNYNNYVQ